jgi:hypothetical protein
LNNGARVMEHALAIGNGHGVKPPDNVSALTATNRMTELTL